MKLGVSYNVFDDSIELLEASIKQIRNSVDIVIVITQNISNYGNPIKPEAIEYLKVLRKKGLVDHYFVVKPNSFGHSVCHANEFAKRNLGYELLKNQYNCTHYLSMDSDEMYFTNEFDFVKGIIEQEQIDSTSIYIQDYYKQPEYKIETLANYYVPFIHSISKQPVFGQGFYAYVDPTRMVKSDGRNLIVDSKYISMHHMTTIRLDLKRKYENSSANINFKNIEGMVQEIETFNPKTRDNPKIEVVTDYFNVNQSIENYKRFLNSCK
jgi:hypothetical protein